MANSWLLGGIVLLLSMTSALTLKHGGTRTLSPKAGGPIQDILSQDKALIYSAVESIQKSQASDLDYVNAIKKACTGRVSQLNGRLLKISIHLNATELAAARIRSILALREDERDPFLEMKHQINGTKIEISNLEKENARLKAALKSPVPVSRSDAIGTLSSSEAAQLQDYEDSIAIVKTHSSTKSKFSLLELQSTLQRRSRETSDRALQQAFSTAASSLTASPNDSGFSSALDDSTLKTLQKLRDDILNAGRAIVTNRVMDKREDDYDASLHKLSELKELLAHQESQLEGDKDELIAQAKAKAMKELKQGLPDAVEELPGPARPDNDAVPMYIQRALIQSMEAEIRFYRAQLAVTNGDIHSVKHLCANEVLSYSQRDTIGASQLASLRSSALTNSLNAAESLHRGAGAAAEKAKLTYKKQVNAEAAAKAEVASSLGVEKEAHQMLVDRKAKLASAVAEAEAAVKALERLKIQAKKDAEAEDEPKLGAKGDGTDTIAATAGSGTGPVAYEDIDVPTGASGSTGGSAASGASGATGVTGMSGLTGTTGSAGNMGPGLHNGYSYNEEGDLVRPPRAVPTGAAAPKGPEVEDAEDPLPVVKPDPLVIPMNVSTTNSSNVTLPVPTPPMYRRGDYPDGKPQMGDGDGDKLASNSIGDGVSAADVISDKIVGDADRNREAAAASAGVASLLQETSRMRMRAGMRRLLQVDTPTANIPDPPTPPSPDFWVKDTSLTSSAAPGTDPANSPSFGQPVNLLPSKPMPVVDLSAQTVAPLPGGPGEIDDGDEHYPGLGDHEAPITAPKTVVIGHKNVTQDAASQAQATSTAAQTTAKVDNLVRLKGVGAVEEAVTIEGHLPRESGAEDHKFKSAGHANQYGNTNISSAEADLEPQQPYYELSGKEVLSKYVDRESAKATRAVSTEVASVNKEGEKESPAAGSDAADEAPDSLDALRGERSAHAQRVALAGTAVEKAEQALRDAKDAKLRADEELNMVKKEPLSEVSGPAALLSQTEWKQGVATANFEAAKRVLKFSQDLLKKLTGEQKKFNDDAVGRKHAILARLGKEGVQHKQVLKGKAHQFMKKAVAPTASEKVAMLSQKPPAAYAETLATRKFYPAPAPPRFSAVSESLVHTGAPGKGGLAGGDTEGEKKLDVQSAASNAADVPSGMAAASALVWPLPGATGATGASISALKKASQSSLNAAVTSALDDAARSAGASSSPQAAVVPDAVQAESDDLVQAESVAVYKLKTAAAALKAANDVLSHAMKKVAASQAAVDEGNANVNSLQLQMVHVAQQTLGDTDANSLAELADLGEDLKAHMLSAQKRLDMLEKQLAEALALKQRAEDEVKSDKKSIAHAQEALAVIAKKEAARKQQLVEKRRKVQAEATAKLHASLPAAVPEPTAADLSKMDATGKAKVAASVAAGVPAAKKLLGKIGSTVVQDDSSAMQLPTKKYQPHAKVVNHTALAKAAQPVDPAEEAARKEAAAKAAALLAARKAAKLKAEQDAENEAFAKAMKDFSSASAVRAHLQATLEKLEELDGDHADLGVIEKSGRKRVRTRTAELEAAKQAAVVPQSVCDAACAAAAAAGVPLDGNSTTLPPLGRRTPEQQLVFDVATQAKAVATAAKAVVLSKQLALDNSMQALKNIRGNITAVEVRQRKGQIQVKALKRAVVAQEKKEEEELKKAAEQRRQMKITLAEQAAARLKKAASDREVVDAQFKEWEAASARNRTQFKALKEKELRTLKLGDCSLRMSCNECVSLDTHCGWCGVTQRCVAGSVESPLFNGCPAAAWYHGSHSAVSKDGTPAYAGAVSHGQNKKVCPVGKSTVPKVINAVPLLDGDDPDPEAAKAFLAQRAAQTKVALETRRIQLEVADAEKLQDAVRNVYKAALNSSLSLVRPVDKRWYAADQSLRKGLAQQKAALLEEEASKEELRVAILDLGDAILRRKAASIVAANTADAAALALAPPVPEQGSEGSDDAASAAAKAMRAALAEEKQDLLRVRGVGKNASAVVKNTTSVKEANSTSGAPRFRNMGVKVVKQVKQGLSKPAKEKLAKKVVGQKVKQATPATGVEQGSQVTRVVKGVPLIPRVNATVPPRNASEASNVTKPKKKAAVPPPVATSRVGESPAVRRARLRALVDLSRQAQLASDKADAAVLAAENRVSEGRVRVENATLDVEDIAAKLLLLRDKAASTRDELAAALSDVAKELVEMRKVVLRNGGGSVSDALNEAKVALGRSNFTTDSKNETSKQAAAAAEATRAPVKVGPAAPLTSAQRAAAAKNASKDVASMKVKTELVLPKTSADLTESFEDWKKRVLDVASQPDENSVQTLNAVSDAKATSDPVGDRTVEDDAQGVNSDGPIAVELLQVNTGRRITRRAFRGGVRRAAPTAGIEAGAPAVVPQGNEFGVPDVNVSVPAPAPIPVAAPVANETAPVVPNITVVHGEHSLPEERRRDEAHALEVHGLWASEPANVPESTKRVIAARTKEVKCIQQKLREARHAVLDARNAIAAVVAAARQAQKLVHSLSAERNSTLSQVAAIEHARSFAATSVLHTNASLVKDELLVKEANARLEVVTKRLSDARHDALVKGDAATAAAKAIVRSENQLDTVLLAARATHARLLIASGVKGAEEQARNENLLQPPSIGCDLS